MFTIPLAVQQELSATTSASAVPAHPAEATRDGRRSSRFSRLDNSSEADQSSPEPSAFDPAAKSALLGAAGRAVSSAAGRHPLLLLEEHCAALAADRSDPTPRYGAGSTYRLLRQLLTKQDRLNDQQLVLRIETQHAKTAVLEDIAMTKSALRYIDHLVRHLKVDVHEHSVTLDADIRMLKNGQTSIMTKIENLETTLGGIQVDLNVLDELKMGINGLSTEQSLLRSDVQAISTQLGTVLDKLMDLLTPRCPEGTTVVGSDRLCLKCPDGYLAPHTDNNCYKLAATKLNYDDANSKCISDDGTLAIMTMENRELLYGLVEHTPEMRAWIGVFKVANEPFKLVNGSPLVFEDWLNGVDPEQSVFAFPRCVYAAIVGGSEGWEPNVCSLELNFICQRLATVVPPLAWAHAVFSLR